MRISESVCAVIYGPAHSRWSPELASAIARQDTQPDVVLANHGRLGPATRWPTGWDSFSPDPRESPFAAGVRAAASTGHRWLWLLDGCAVPAPDALGKLLTAAADLGPPAALLMASKVLDEDGRFHPDAMPRHEIFEKQNSIRAAEQHLVQLRTAAHGSVVVASAAVARFGLPRSDLFHGLEMVEWSARLLRSWEDVGYVVPASVAVRPGPPAVLPLRYWLGRAQVLRSSGWSSNEKLWETFLLGEALTGALRGRLRSGARSRRGPGL